MNLLKSDAKINNLIAAEMRRQKESIELIPSENNVSPAVLQATGSVLTNKYAEGYPGKRYYGGNEVIDEVENLAIERAKKLFKAEHANVQPYSGTPANFAIYLAFLKLGDKVLGLELTQGGHLTHGSSVSFSGQAFNFIPYGVYRNSGEINYNAIYRLCLQHKPKMIVAGASAYSRKINFKKIAEIAKKCGAYTFADISHISGLIAAGLHSNPVPYFDVVMTTTHKTLRGPRGAIIMCKEKYAKIIDKTVFPGFQGGPHENTIAAIAVALKEASSSKFKYYAKQIIKNAKVLAKELEKHDFKVVGNGTENHLFLVHLKNKNITGKQAEDLLGRVGIVVNRNTVPNETGSPMNPSGIRLGTPLITTRGMKERDMVKIAGWINEAIMHRDHENELVRIAKEVKTFAKKWPLFK